MLRTSMMILLLVCIAAPSLASLPETGPEAVPDYLVAADDTLWLTETVEILGSRVPAALPGVVRTVSLMSSDSLDRLPARSAAEALAMVPAVDVGQRRQYGVQADISIRGSTFEQVQVLFDGTDIGDPQTGHHSFDLPVGSADIERIEVLRGHGSALYGANAFGGVVNVVPRRPAETGGGDIVLTGGAHGTWGARTALDTGPWAGEARTRFSAETFRTDGDRPGTDADNLSFTSRTVIRSDNGESDIFAGWARREFGAVDFYSPYPSRERTETLLVAARMRGNLSRRVTVEPRINFRRHEDRFVLDRSDPGAYTNDHVTNRIGSELRAVVGVGGGVTLAMTGEGVHEEIDSEGVRRVEGETVQTAALGDHSRRRAAAGVEAAGFNGSVRWTANMRLDARKDYSPRYSRSAALNIDAGRDIDLRASAGTAFRVPTFTELYYEDPVNRGDPSLKPERGWTWDVGLDSSRGPWSMSWTFFERHEKDLIDWARPIDDPGSPWQAANIASGRVRGLVQSMRYAAPRGHVFAVNYSRFRKRTELPDGLVSKYGLLAPRQLVSLEASLRLGPALDASIIGRYKERRDGVDSFVVDLGIGVRTGGWLTRTTITNLCDRSYQEIPGVEMPGTLITFSLGRSFGGT